VSAYWSATSTGSSLVIGAPAGAAKGGIQVRVRGLAGSVTAAGALTITDSVGGVVFQVTITNVLGIPDLDVRGTVGGNLTIALTNGNGLNAQGDFVLVGWPYGLI
jgi:hypothetical protein